MPRFRFPNLIVAALCLVCSPVFSAPPRDELLRLVPDDAGLCLLVQNLRQQLDRLHQSPFAAKLAASPIGQSFRNAPELKHLAAFDQRLLTQLQITWAQLRDDILGDAIVVAHTPELPDKSQKEQGLILLHARNPDRLAALFDRLNEVQRESGELVAVESRQFGSQPYVRRQKKDGEEFYFIRGPLLVFSDCETRLHKVIECDRRRPPADREPPEHLRRLQGLAVEQNLFTLLVNPRAFDLALRQKLNGAQGAEASALKSFAQCWSAIDAAALTVRLERDLSFALAVQARPDALPPTLRKFLGEVRRPAAVWSAFPSDALFAAAGRVPWEPAADAGGEALPPEGRKFFQDALERSVGAILGKDTLPQLLRQIGPEWGVCLAPPESGGNTWLPSFTGVVQLRPGGSPPLEKRVLGALDVFIGLVVRSANNQNNTRLQLQRVFQGPVEVRVVEGGQFLPPGLRPAFAYKGDYLVFGSSPDAILRFEPPAATNSALSADEAPLVRLALAGWAKYLRNYREPLAAFAAEAHHLELSDVQRRLDRLLETLELFDRIELTQRTQSNRATVTLRLQTAAALQSP